MNPATLKAHLAALGLTQTDFARLCSNPRRGGASVSDRTVRNWCAGSSPIPPYAVEALDEARALAKKYVGEAPDMPGAVGGVLVLGMPRVPGVGGFPTELQAYPPAFWWVVAARVRDAWPTGSVTIEYMDEETA